jgi:hypothetical protein
MLIYMCVHVYIKVYSPEVRRAFDRPPLPARFLKPPRGVSALLADVDVDDVDDVDATRVGPLSVSSSVSSSWAANAVHDYRIKSSVG